VKKKLIKNINGVEDFSYAILFDKAIHPVLSPGQGLRVMNANSAQSVSRVVHELASQTPKYLKLMEFIRTQITQTTTDAVYGPVNPFNNPKIHQAYWYVFSPILVCGLSCAPGTSSLASLSYC